MAEIKTVTIDELRQMNDQEGLILQGCGGDLQEWVDGINELFAQGRAEQDEEARKQIYADLQAAIQDTAAFYPICSNNKILLISNRIQGVEEAGLVPVYTFEDTYYLSEAE